MNSKQQDKLMKSIQPNKGIVWGIILMLLVQGFIVSFLIRIFGNNWFSIGASYVVAIGVGGIYIRLVKKRNTKKRNYIAMVQQQKIRSLDEISRRIPTTYETVVKDLTNMIQEGFFPNTYIDDAKREIVLPPSGETSGIAEIICPFCGAKNPSDAANSKCQSCGAPLH